MPLIDQVNIACGFHASDPPTMASTVALAKAHGKLIGAHPSLPDRDGFGRREMKIERSEMAAILIYQVGALKGFLDAAGVPLNHIKIHGVLYGMAARDPQMMHAICDAADVFRVPVFGMAGTLHQSIMAERGITFVPELFVDLDYDATGRLVILRQRSHFDPQLAAARTRQAVSHGLIDTADGATIPAIFDTICLHSDVPNALEVVRAVRASLDEVQGARP